jgi:hypothetical protein
MPRIASAVLRLLRRGGPGSRTGGREREDGSGGVVVNAAEHTVERPMLWHARVLVGGRFCWVWVGAPGGGRTHTVTLLRGVAPRAY